MVETETDIDDGDAVLADIGLSRSVTVQLTVVGMLGLVVSFGLFGGLYAAVTGHPPSFSFAPGVEWWNGALDGLVVLAVGTAVIVPHEWFHGLGIRHYGGEVSYGVGLSHFVLPYAYATTDHEFTRNQFVVVLLAPLVGITLVGVPVMLALEWGWLVVPLAANAGGAVGDLWMTLVVFGYPAHVRVTDHAAGMRIVGRPGDEAPDLSPTGLVWDALVGAAAATVAALVVVGLLGPLVLSALGVSSVTVGTPGTFTFLFSYAETPTSLSFAVGVGWLFVGGLLGLAYALARSVLRQRRARAATGPAT